MKLKIKLTILFSLLALIPLALISNLSYVNQRSVLLKKTAEHMIAFADIQERRVNEKLDRYLAEMKLITAKTDLRQVVAESNFSKKADRALVSKICGDAVRNTEYISDISVFDKTGKFIASNLIVPEASASGEVLEEKILEEAKTSHMLKEIFYDENNILQAKLYGPLVLDGEVIGVVRVISAAAPLVSVTEDYTGLGETGEIVLAKRNEAGDAVFITPLRFDIGGALSRVVPSTKSHVPITSALLKQEKVMDQEEIVDYRGEPVLAVTRYIDPLDWGMVVKIDRAEVFASVSEIRNATLAVTILGTFIILVISFLVTQRIVDPIIDLTHTAESIKDGRFVTSLLVTEENEIGILAQAFNTMVMQLKTLYVGLEKKVSERTRDLQKFKLAVDSASDQIVITDDEGTIIYANDMLRKITGYKPEEAMGTKAGVKWGKKMPREFYVRMWDVIKNKKQVFNGEITNVRKNGEEYIASVQISPVLDDLGNVAFFVGIERDISREKEVDKMKTEFISLASHQLRTPLTAIRWFTEMLEDGDLGKLEPDIADVIEKISISTKRMIDLVNGLLNISRLESGRIIIDPVPTQIKTVLENVIQDATSVLSKKNQKVNLEAQGIPEINLDQKLIANVCLNLITNASKYSPDGSEIQIKAKKANGHLKVSVSDKGIGIPEDVKSKVFVKFFRAENAIHTEAEGTGLGLYLAKSIIEASGGSIGFESEEGKGTTFWFTIPLAGVKAKEGEVNLQER